MYFRFVLAVLAAFAGSVGGANAAAHIHIDLSTQTMNVDSSSGSYSWPVSTARAGYSTPRGSYAPTGLQRMHYSKKYHNSPMPYSIFFRGGYAIHGTYATGALGRPASHGCVRLSPAHAAMLYRMVQQEGGSISITGSPPGGGKRYASAGKTRARYASLRKAYRPMAYDSYGRPAPAGVQYWQAHPVAPLYYYPPAY